MVQNRNDTNLITAPARYAVSRRVLRRVAMKALTKILAGGVFATALVTAAPAAAQYYPSPYGYGNGSGVVGQVINQVLGGGYGGYGGYGGGYGNSSQMAVNQCTSAVQARLQRNYGYGSYGYGYGYAPVSTARVLGISRVEPRSSGGLTVRGVATSGRVAAYGYQGQQPVDLTFKCRTDYRGFVVDVDVDRAEGAYSYNQPYTPYNQYDYSQYGYRRY
jgi:hypothetical protein